jgi:hypothetical protein
MYIEDIRNALNCHSVAKHYKFDARGTVVPNTAIASASAVEIKMAISQVQSMLILVQRNEVCYTIQRKFCIQYHKERSSRPIIYSLHKNFVETECSMRHVKSPSRQCVSDATVEQCKALFEIPCILCASQRRS